MKTPPSEEESDAGKRSVCLYLDNEVMDILEQRSKELRRSKSWLANESMRHDLGLTPKEQ